ncbi:MAG: DUF1292 domain-containing protein [Lachnospiraceae bacterium]|nr:DUF1292 domain-containing protein [Lachnospiraceae bacterium]
MDEIFPVDENDRDVMVTLTLDDDTELNCEILIIFEVDDQSYIALLPVDDDGNPIDEDGVIIDEPEAILYKYSEEADGSPIIENIVDEEEYDTAAEIFEKIQNGDYEEDDE